MLTSTILQHGLSHSSHFDILSWEGQNQSALYDLNRPTM